MNALKAGILTFSLLLSTAVEAPAKKSAGDASGGRPFIVHHDKAPAPDGLDGANIALWQSHGKYFEPKLNRWEWQRARLMQTVEDLYTQSYVMPFLMPMLENAGAYVMSPRERDTSLTEIIADNDESPLLSGSFATTGKWKKADTCAFAYRKAELHNGDRPFAEGTALQTRLSGSDKATATASWKAAIPDNGSYAVYISYVTLPASTTAAQYRIHAADGIHAVTVNQRMGAGTWIYLGHFQLAASDTPETIVELLNSGKERNAVVTADAVKIGGGMGNVARIVKEPLDSIDYEYTLSDSPRFVEGARYFLQWAGAPDSVFTPSDYVNDYNDDYQSRALWVNWLAGGSPKLPARKGLGIPVDLSFAFHSDAGTTLNDSIIGTLGIYCTAGDTLGDGRSRSASLQLSNSVMENIVNDIRSSFEPRWTNRGMWNKSYYEARVPQVPAMLLELLSHQNLADMSYGLDPSFRFAVSRAIYKGMLKFLAKRDGREYVVQPLPVRAFAINRTGADSFSLTWQARP
ncbi:MAG: N-acetylmuramoyl-L-alanine amidase, partial [Muribaculaceae bacterium]|nr:N-acetylmuramoyl-L-alanine amidase [Muribaculaceae bacterium]